MQQLRMAHKLWAAVIAIVIALVAVVGFSGYRTSKSQAQAEASARIMNAKIEAALRWVGLTETNAARTLALVVSKEAELAAQFKEAIPATSAQITEIQKNIEAMQPSEADKAQLAKIAAARKAMLELRTEATRLKDAGQTTEASALVR